METTAREVITEEYRRQQQELHKNPNYGVASLQFAPTIAKLIRQLGVTSLSDYGAGKKNLLRGLTEQGVTIDYRPYDPAFPEYGPPRPADMVCCIDVLEHIEPDCLDAVLDELRDMTTRLGVFTVHTGPAQKILSDGRNAHLIQKPSSWWLPRLCERFEVEGFQKVPNGFLVMVAPRKAS